MPDLFISYAHVDKHWVDVFVPLLEQRLNQQAGRAKPDRIWKDNRFASNVGITPEIDAQLAQAQCLLSIISPGYLASEWCLYELQQFNARVGTDSGRIFHVELDQLAPQRKPALLSQMLGVQFWRQDPLSKRTYPLNAGEREYEDRLLDLAKDIAAVLVSAADKSLAGQAPTPRMDDVISPLASSSPLCKRGAGGDFLQQKLAGLEQRRARLQELLTRQQQELDFTDDPKRQMKLERDIQATQTSLAQVETDLARYQSPTAGL